MVEKGTDMDLYSVLVGVLLALGFGCGLSTLFKKESGLLGLVGVVAVCLSVVIMVMVKINLDYWPYIET